MDTTQSTTSGTNASDTASNTSQIRSELASALSSADTNAAQTVRNIGLVQQARLSGLSRTAANLKAQYGAGDAQVQKAEAAVAATANTVARVAMVNRQLTTPAPQVSANGWMLHGRVVNSELQPVAGFTVFLVDGQKTYQQIYGFAYTDDTGYFLLSYAGSKSQSPGQTQGPAAPELFIEVANAEVLPVYLSSSPFQPTLGSDTYQNVILPSGGQPIGDPPEAIRKVALPSKKKG